ncbi:sugar transferase [Brevibacillus sp. 179-C9.3 HS]|uniref:sugar transferase n=1 Tax=unclassified Brevibacillus TaxID=2684853 RepID=UPI0039A21D2D
MKFIFDWIFSLALLIVLSPVFIVLMILIRLKLGAPVFFTQERPGLEGKPFHILKFRTMTDQKDEHGHLLPNEARVTRFGSFLRKYSLDELPQLVNVLRGELSLVGPRPLRMEYLPRYNNEQARRHDVKPGITGWAQVNGRNAITWEEKFELDVWYVDNRSFWLDMKIILMTVRKVFHHGAANQQENVFMEDFMGSQASSTDKMTMV